MVGLGLREVYYHVGHAECHQEHELLTEHSIIYSLLHCDYEADHTRNLKQKQEHLLLIQILLYYLILTITITITITILILIILILVIIPNDE